MLLNNPDDVRLVLMDVDMPIMDGIQVNLVIILFLGILNYNRIAIKKVNKRISNNWVHCPSRLGDS